MQLLLHLSVVKMVLWGDSGLKIVRMKPEPGSMVTIYPSLYPSVDCTRTAGMPAAASLSNRADESVITAAKLLY